MSPTLLGLLTFFAVALSVAGAYSILADLFLRDRSRVSSRVDDEFRKMQRGRAERSSLFRNLGQLAAEAEAGVGERRSIAKRFVGMVEQSGLDLSPRKLLAIAIACGSALGLPLGALRASLLLGAGGFAVGGLIPILYVRHKKNARLDKLRSQLPEAFDLMSRVIRAGQTMSQALLAV